MEVRNATLTDEPAASVRFVLGNSVTTARDRLESWLRDRGAPAARVDDVILASSELMTNARWHGGGPVQVECQVDDERIALAVTNQADPSDVPDPGDWSQPRDPLAPSGRGLGIVKALADRAVVDRSDHRLSIRTEFRL